MSASTPAARRLAEETIDAHGGIDAWRRASSLQVAFSARGLAFAAKGCSAALRAVHGEFSTTGESRHLRGSGAEPWEFAVRDRAQLLDAMRPLGAPARKRRWSTADAAAFAATAMSTYVSLPFILLDARVQLDVKAPTRSGHRRLVVHYPSTIATHCPEQTLHIDADGVIRRHDYTALAFGRWARAAQQLHDHTWFDGILVPTRRIVTPRFLGHPLPAPRLVVIDVRSVRAACPPASGS